MGIKLSEEQQRSNSAERREELATAALATLNNITFYRDSSDLDEAIDDTLTNICKGIIFFFIIYMVPLDLIISQHHVCKVVALMVM